jgi:hypothetical protein
MVDNRDFLGTIDTNPYNLEHFGLLTFNLIVIGRQIPTETLIIDPSHEKTTTLAYKTLFEGTGIHHSNAGLQITHDMHINGYFMLLYDLRTDQASSQGHTSPVENENIRIEFTFKEALKQAITCLLCLEYNSVRVNFLRTITTDFKKTWTTCR